MNKKTRSEWGSWEDFKKVVPGAHHVERILPLDMNYCELTLAYSSFDATSETPEEARRLVVEKYAATLDAPPLPWLPDYDLSTVEGCKEAIKANDFIVELPVLKIQHKVCGAYCKVPLTPKIEDWQTMARYAIKHNKIIEDAE